MPTDSTISPEFSAEKTKEVLRKVREIEIRTNRLVNESLAGEYHSAFKGQGMNFDEVREYQAGDEVRNIDWNVTARTGKPFIKKFIEERELTIMLMIDVSPSGIFGSGEQTKRDLAAELGSMFAFSAIRNKDKVGLLLFSDDVEHYVPPQKGNNHVLRVIRDILFFKAEGKRTKITKALDHANQVLNRRSVIILISDFWMNPPYQENLDQLIQKMDITNRKHDLISVSVTDPIENVLVPGVICSLEDIETGESLLIDTRNAKTVDSFRKMSLQRSEEFSKALKRRRMDLLQLVVGKPYIKEVHRYFKLRASRRS